MKACFAFLKPNTKYLFRGIYVQKDLFWYTEYPTIPYLEIPVAPNLGIIAAVVRDRHASIIVERIHPENFKACSHKYDLSADDPQRRGVACAVIPDATAYKIPYLPEMGVGTIIQESVRKTSTHRLLLEQTDLDQMLFISHGKLTN